MKRPTETQGDWEEYARWLENLLFITIREDAWPDVIVDWLENFWDRFGEV